MHARPVLDFWFEFASPYAYLAATRIEEAAREAVVTVRWRPFLLGPIFAAQGWTTSPVELFPAKGRYMWRDVAREAAARGVPFRRPDPFPQNGLTAARLALAIGDDTVVPAFARAVFRAEFADGRTIGEPHVLRDILDGLGQDGASIAVRATSDAVKAALRRQTEEAVEAGIFGAPSFVTADGELFWGNDRLEAALAWAAADRP